MKFTQRNVVQVEVQSWIMIKQMGNKTQNGGKVQAPRKEFMDDHEGRTEV